MGYIIKVPIHKTLPQQLAYLTCCGISYRKKDYRIGHKQFTDIELLDSFVCFSDMNTIITFDSKGNLV